jgi:hypothetical protein
VAKNLAGWPPYRVSDVVSIQNAVFSYGKNIRDTDLYDGTLEYLKEMAELLEGQEWVFYNTLNIKDFRELQNKLDKANRDPGFMAMTSGAVTSLGEEDITNRDLV